MGPQFPVGGTWTNDGRWLAVDYFHGYLYEMYPETGEMIDIGGGGVNLNGLAYNPVDNKLYAAASYSLYEFDIETGRTALLSERFKKGEKIAEKAGDFNIISSGEYYHEDKLVFTPKGVEKQKVFGVKSYLKSIMAEKGSLFGFVFVYKGRTPKKYKFKIIHPEFSTLPGQEKTEFELDILCEYNKEDNLLWHFSEEHEMVP